MSFLAKIGLKPGGGRRRADARVPNGMRVYAIGDVHGHADLLDELIAMIEEDWRRRPARRRALVFLGDLIDRGPDSRAVVERVSTLELESAELIFLAGNHEEVLLRLLGGEPSHFADWLRFGGRQFLASYGEDADALAALPARAAVARLREAIPRRHRHFLAAMADTVRIGDYLFVHAGIRPGVPVEAQSQADLRWIRAPFLDDDSDHGVVVVHGHTITADVEWRSNRIGIDTGAYQSGVLTALVLEGGERRLLQSGAAQPNAIAEG